MTIDTFQHCTVDDVKRVITSAASSCAWSAADAVLKEFLPGLLPFLTDLCNASLRPTEGSLPVTQRHAIVFPRVKKAGADPADVCNYRPISNLTFMSKVVEILVCRQLMAFLDTGYYQTFSRPTGCNTVLRLQFLRLSRTFSGQQTVARWLTLLVRCVCRLRYRRPQYIGWSSQHSFGIRGAVLSWIQSFITGRTQAVRVGDDESAISSVLCGVPQGSVLGPMLFLLYTADVLNIIQRHGLVGHSYADDSSVYLHHGPFFVLRPVTNCNCMYWWH